MRIKKKCKAFTLVELLIVIVIIGILAGLIIWALRSAVVKARDAQAKNSVKVVQDAIEVYLTENPNLRESDFGNGFPNTSTYYELDNTRLGNLVAGQKLITSTPKDGQNQLLKLRIAGSTTYIIQAKSATNSRKCWFSSAGTNVANYQNNLSSSSPRDCIQ